MIEKLKTDSMYIDFSALYGFSFSTWAGLVILLI